jgi:hypothetical protein
MKLTDRRADADLRRQLITAVAIVFSILINTISNIFPPNGVNIGELSNTLFAEVRVTPANYAFAIWGLIYSGLVALGIFQFQSTERYNPPLAKVWLFVDDRLCVSMRVDLSIFGTTVPVICNCHVGDLAIINRHVRSAGNRQRKSFPTGTMDGADPD